jgi:hypothetical protein
MPGKGRVRKEEMWIRTNAVRGGENGVISRISKGRKSNEGHVPGRETKETDNYDALSDDYDGKRG